MIRKWSKERVIEAIRRRQREGRLLHRAWREDSALYSAAWRYFGGWRRTLLAAGLPTRRPTAERVLTAIQDRHRQGLPLWGVSRYDHSLWRAACRYWGSWSAAIRAAGFNNVPRYKWDRQTIITALQAIPPQDDPLREHEVPPLLFMAACRLFGGWRAALRAAGLPARPSPQTWNQSKVLAAIQLQYRQGRSITSRGKTALVQAAIRVFGSWREAVQRAGADSPYQRWSPRRVLDELRLLQQRGQFDETIWTENRKLASAARRYFGTWRSALAAAGILDVTSRQPVPRKWTVSRMIEAIQDRHVKGLPMLSQADRRLASAAARYFGSWHAALLAAGLDVGPPPKPRRKWTQEAVIDELRAAHRSETGLSGLGKRNASLACAARQWFGSLHEALIAAGIARPEPGTEGRCNCCQEKQSGTARNRHPFHSIRE